MFAFMGVVNAFDVSRIDQKGGGASSTDKHFLMNGSVFFVANRKKFKPHHDVVNYRGSHKYTDISGWR